MAAVMATSVLAFGEDWPQYRGPKGDGISRETGLLDSWPADGPKKVWEKPVGIGYASPVAADGVVYLFTLDDGKETLRAFDAATGQEKWKQQYDGGWNGQYEGTRASPVIETGKIYTYGGSGDLVCRNIADGKEIWHINVLKETGAQPLTWGQASNPLIVADTIYVQGGKGGALCVAVDKNTGKITWKSGNAVGGYAKPVMIQPGGKDLLAIFGGDAIHTVDPKDGKIVWSFPWKTNYEVNAATPLYSDGKLFITSNYGAGCALFDLTAVGGKKAYANHEIQSRFQTPIMEGDILYGNSEGRFKALTWKDGKALWTASDRIGFGGSFLRIEGDRMILLSDHGDLILASATPKAYKHISTAHLFDYDQVWTSPVVYNGKVYCKGKDSLLCLDIKK